MNRINLAKKLGLKIKIYNHDRTWGLYDGKIVHISSASPVRDIDHEIGHFLAASARERTKPEWDLGRGPDYPHEDVMQMFGLKDLVNPRTWEDRNPAKDKYADKREGMASLLGIAVTYVIGKKDEWREHADWHTWDRSNTACDLFCLIRDTDHHMHKNRLTKVLAQLNIIMGRS